MRPWHQFHACVFPPNESLRFDDASFPKYIWRWAALAALASFLVCMSLAGRRGLWLDEYLTLKAVQLDYPALIAERLNAGHSPLYFIYAKLLLWHKTSLYALRLTSALMAGFNVLALTGLLLSLGLRRVLPAMWLVAIFLPYWIVIGTEYRYMMFLTAAVSGMLWLAVRYAEAPSMRRGVVLALAAGGVAWIHASALIPIVLTGIFIGIENRRKGKSIGTAATGAWPVWAGLASSIPLLMRIAGHKSVAHSDLPNPIGTLLNLIGTVLGDSSNLVRQIGNGYWAIYMPAAVFVLMGIIGSRRILIATGRTTAWKLLATLLAGMPAVFLIACLFKNHQGPVRYLATYAIPCSICLAVYLTGLWSDRLTRGMAVAVALLLVCQAGIIGLSHGEMLREAVHWIVAMRRPQDSVLVSHARLPIWQFKQEGVRTGIIEIKSTELDKLKIANEITSHTRAGSRGIGVLYHTDAPVVDTLKDMQKSGAITAWRKHKVSNSVILVVWIRSPEDEEWLRKIPWP